MLKTNTLHNNESISKQGKYWRPGFTLIELTVVVGVIMVLSAIAIPSFSRAYPFYKVRTEAKSFMVMAQMARQRAVAKNKPVRLLIDCRSEATCAVALQTPINMAAGTIDNSGWETDQSTYRKFYETVAVSWGESPDPSIGSGTDWTNWYRLGTDLKTMVPTDVAGADAKKTYAFIFLPNGQAYSLSSLATTRLNFTATDNPEAWWQISLTPTSSRVNAKRGA